MQPTSHTNASSTTVGTTASSTALIGGSNSKKVTTVPCQALRNPISAAEILDRAALTFGAAVQSSSTKLFKSLFKNSSKHQDSSAHGAEDSSDPPKESAVKKLARLRKQAGDPSVQAYHFGKK